VGAGVAIADIADDAGELLAKELCAVRPDAAYYRHHDVGDEASWTALVDDVNGRFGPVSVLANNAGILRFGEIATGSVEDVELMWRVNQLGVFLGMRAVTPTMLANGGGSIINASSVEGLAGMAGCTGYAATKWAIRGMTKCAAMELGPRGIRVNSVHPGMIDTPMTRVHGGDAAMEYGASKVPMRRVGYPDDIAPVYVFLASDESGYMNGAELAVDGGVTATHAFGG
jgi:3alpha(or 20beta)-hydroxysteroid dehydrogenase